MTATTDLFQGFLYRIRIRNVQHTRAKRAIFKRYCQYPELQYSLTATAIDFQNATSALCACALHASGTVLVESGR